MSNRILIGAGVIAMYIGCGTVAHPEPDRAGGVDEMPQNAASGNGATVLPCPCPDPPNCTCGNGTGVYAAEGGLAGITVQVGEDTRFVARPIMITHFINNGSGPSGNVTFRYGYFNPSTNQWNSPGIGHVDSADYGQQNNFKVTSVHETSVPTAPIWELLNPKTNTPVRVTDPQMAALRLHISFTVSGVTSGSSVTKTALLYFNAATKIARVGGGYVYAYSMQWKNLSDASIASPQQYCQGPSQQPDTVVFQQGIDVDPVKGKVTRLGAANFVTLSCSLGAPAKVYAWGYPYQGSSASDTFYFDAGIHMKRASYCGDLHHYTKANTEIYKSDDKKTNDQISPSPPYNPHGLEAWWGTSGALCVNSENMRHFLLAPTNIKLMSCGGQPHKIGQPLQNCSFICNDKLLPTCPPGRQPPWPQFLADGPKFPKQP